MSYRDFLFAGAGALAIIALMLIWSRAPGAYSRFSLLGCIRKWARVPFTTAALFILCAAVIPASVLIICAQGRAPYFDALGEASYSAPDDKDDQAVASLRAYVDQMPQSAHLNQTPIASGRKDLPDVETMISRLAARLEIDKSDKDGWRTLGWSYLNTERYADAIKAYETALALDPTDSEIKASLEDARSKLSGPAAPSASPIASPQTN